jgi:hypothetical protein
LSAAVRREIESLPPRFAVRTAGKSHE